MHTSDRDEMIRQYHKLFPEHKEMSAYPGWVTDFAGTTFAGKKLALDLRSERDRLALYFLASAWSRTGKFEGPVRLIIAMLSDPERYLNRPLWSSTNHVNEQQEIFSELIKIGAVHVCIKGGRVASARSDCIESFGTIAQHFRRIDDLCMTANDDHSARQAYQRLRKIRGTGYGNCAWNIKIPLVFRELRCQRVVEVPGQFCCVPDLRVARTYLQVSDPLRKNTLEASQQIYQDFGDWYDLPPFWAEPSHRDKPRKAPAKKRINPSVVEDPANYELCPPHEQGAIPDIDGYQPHEKVRSAVKRAIRAVFPEGDDSTYTFYMQRGEFTGTLTDEGVSVSNLRNDSLLEWDAFTAAVVAQMRAGGTASRGNARTQGNKLGHPELCLDSVEGYVAFNVYGKIPGQTVFCRISPIAAILEAAGISERVPCRLSLNGDFKKQITNPDLGLSPLAKS